MKKIAIIVCTNFEDIELIATIDVLSRANIQYDLISNENKNEVHGSKNAIVKTHHIDDIDFNEYSSIFIPGGEAVNKIIEDDYILKIVNNFHKQNKNIYAICAAPAILKKLNILKNIKHTAYPGYGYEPTLQEKNVVHNKNIITGIGPGATLKFAFSIVENEKGMKIVKDLKKAMKM